MTNFLLSHMANVAKRSFDNKQIWISPKCKAIPKVQDFYVSHMIPAMLNTGTVNEDD